LHPAPLFALSRIDPAVEDKARDYLAMLAIGMPAVLFYRTFHAFCNALGRPRPLLLISLGSTLLHGLLAWSLVTGKWGGEALGVRGCGVSNAAVSWFSMLCASGYLCFARALQPYRLLAGSPAGSCRGAGRWAHCCALACRWASPTSSRFPRSR